MEKNNNIDISIIIPVYNVEEFLPECIDSLMQQGVLRMEIILVNDGSYDSSGVIADLYASRDNRIRVIHQENRGASAARNAGLKLAHGRYIVFIDSDDWVKKDSIYELYREAVNHHADVVMGKFSYFVQNEIIDSPFKPIPKEILNILFPGKECFIRLVTNGAYSPMPFNYLYRRNYLEKIQARFEEGIIFEDEIWTSTVICQAERMLVVDIDFYFYRQREGSVMRSSSLIKRLDSYFIVTEKLIEFSDRFDFSGEDGELKNWLYVNIYRIYTDAFSLVAKIKDSSIMVTRSHFDRFLRDCWEMMPVPQRICNKYYRIAETGLKKYTDWRTSEWVASINHRIESGKKLMLIYNTVQDDDLYLQAKGVPADWLITTDRRYFKQADAVVFYLPCLYQELENDMDKPEGQIWISWHLVTENDHPLINNQEIREVFDLCISYQQEEAQKKHILTSICRVTDEILSETDKVFCPCCGKSFGRFVNFEYNRPYLYDIERFKYAYKNIECPYCFSKPRQRIACYYFDSMCVEEGILMFGAEYSMKKYFDRKNYRYTTADLFDRAADLTIDIQDIQLPDEQWDLIICNHVLEHVTDYKKALIEIKRILKKTGILEITVPTDRNSETVYEDFNITTAKDRIKAFGQSDHLRIFGNDFENILSSAGFFVDIVDVNKLPAEMVGVIGPANYDDNRVYICRKNG